MEESVFYNLSQDETLGGDSPSIHKIPSQAALKAYIDSKAGSGGPNYFYVEDASGAANTLTIKKSNNALPDKVFEWSLDKQNWTEITVTDTTGVSIAVPANGRVYLRGDNGILTDNNGNYYTQINCAALFSIGGDITTLLSKPGWQLVLYDYALKGLFDNGLSGKLFSAENLKIPAVYLGSSSLNGLFRDNKNLQKPPTSLFAQVMKYQSMAQMFYGCTALTEAPALPSTALSQNCYDSMFRDCTALTEAPALPATTLGNSSYSGMFRGCSNLARVEVYATAWTSQTNWLDGVSPTGDFYNLGGATIPTGTNGIPSGWTEHTALP